MARSNRALSFSLLFFRSAVADWGPGASLTPPTRPQGTSFPGPSRGSSMSDQEVNRRDFIKTSAAAGAALGLSAASFTRVYGANERIGVGFLGVGGRCQQHLDVDPRNAEEGHEGRSRRRLRRVGRRRQAGSRQGPRAVPLGQALRPQRGRQEPRHQGLPQHPGPVKDVDVVVRRHAGPLARQDVPSTPWLRARTSTAKSR